MRPFLFHISPYAFASLFLRTMSVPLWLWIDLKGCSDSVLGCCILASNDEEVVWSCARWLWMTNFLLLANKGTCGNSYVKMAVTSHVGPLLPKPWWFCMVFCQKLAIFIKKGTWLHKKLELHSCSLIIKLQECNSNEVIWPNIGWDKNREQFGYNLCPIVPASGYGWPTHVARPRR